MSVRGFASALAVGAALGFGASSFAAAADLKLVARLLQRMALAAEREHERDVGESPNAK